MSIDAMKQALEALCDFDYDKRLSAIDALRVAIEQAQDLIPQDKLFVSGQLGANVTRVREERQWQGLTEEDIWAAIRPIYRDDTSAEMGIEVSMDEYRAIEAKLKEKNT